MEDSVIWIEGASERGRMVVGDAKLCGLHVGSEMPSLFAFFIMSLCS